LELRDYLEILWRNKTIVLITALVTLAVVAAGTVSTTPVFSTTTILRIATNTVGTGSYSDFVYVERLMNTYARIATSKPVLDDLEERLSLQRIPVIKVEILPNTELIQISVEDEDPFLALETANTLAALLVEQGKVLYSGGRKSAQAILSEHLALTEQELILARNEVERLLAETPEDTLGIEDARRSLVLQQEIYGALLEQYEQSMVREAIRENMISIVEPAILPLTPARPRPLLNVILGITAGIIGGIGLAFLIDHLKGKNIISKQIQTERVVHAD
jgi:capsular polysaccharide biosynthesis protein